MPVELPRGVHPIPACRHTVRHLVAERERQAAPYVEVRGEGDPDIGKPRHHRRRAGAVRNARRQIP